MCQCGDAESSEIRKVLVIVTIYNCDYSTKCLILSTCCNNMYVQTDLKLCIVMNGIENQRSNNLFRWIAV